jgi:hypothetical protein
MRLFSQFGKVGAILCAAIISGIAAAQNYSIPVRYDFTSDQRAQAAQGEPVDLTVPGPVASGVPEGSSITGVRVGLRVRGSVEWLPTWREEPPSTLVQFHLPYRISLSLGSSFAQRAGQINAGPLRVKPGLEEQLRFWFDRPLFEDEGKDRIQGGQVSLRHVAKIDEELRFRLSPMGGCRTTLPTA